MPLSIAVVVCAVAPASYAQRTVPDLNGYLTLGNGYWSRGLSQNQGLSLQVGIDWQHQSGFFTGGWAANVDYAVEYSREQPRDIEADVYVGYHQRNGDWSWTSTFGHYLYPGSALPYDYNELSGTVGYRDRVFYTASYSDDFYRLQQHALNQELSFAWPLRGDVEIGAAVGRFELANSAIQFNHWNVGISKLVRRVVVDVRYYDSGLGWVGYLGDPDADHYVLSVSYALHGKRTRI